MSVTAVLIVVAVAVIGATLAMTIARRLAPDGGFLGTPEPNHTGSVLAALGAGFAILTAFVLLLAFQSYLNAKRNAETEAGSTQELFLLSEYFDSPARERLENDLICYARAVVFDEWPRMRHQQSSAVVDGWDLALERAIHEVSVTTGQDAAEYAEWLDQRALRDQGRRERLQEAIPFVPTLLWLALIGGAALLIGYVCLFANPRIRLWPQLAVVGAVAAVASINLSVVRFLDRPYEQVEGAIHPTSMRESLRTMEVERAQAAVRTPLPCDRRGRPLGATSA